MLSMSETLVRKDTKQGNRRVICWRASGYTVLTKQMLGCITAPAGIHCMETLTVTEQKPSHASHLCKHTHLLLLSASQRDVTAVYRDVCPAHVYWARYELEPKDPICDASFSSVTLSSILTSLEPMLAFLSVPNCLRLTIYRKPPGKDAIIQCSTWLLTWKMNEWMSEWVVEDTRAFEWHRHGFHFPASASYLQHDLGKSLNWL